MANFYSILLTLVCIAAGLIWWYDAKVNKPKREARIAAEEQRLQQQLDAEARERLAPQGGLAEFAQSVFPILLIILLLRSFVYEPFRIPSASMMPTMLAGDFILVEKYSYSLRDPIWRTELVNLGKPERGDIAVFKYPPDESFDYIKRVVGLPGDRIIYQNKTLYIQPACADTAAQCPPLEMIRKTAQQQNEVYFSGSTPLLRFTEQLGESSHEILVNPASANLSGEWVVPAGHYFMMGDNRDNSEDSRFWGFVPEQNLVGRASFIWMSFEMDRSADSWLPQWFPTGVRWQRLGTVE